MLVLVASFALVVASALTGGALAPTANAAPCPDGSQTCGPQPTQDPGPTQRNQGPPTTAPQAPQTTVPPNADTGAQSPPTNGNPGFQGTVQAMPTPDNPNGCIVNCGQTSQTQGVGPTTAQAPPRVIQTSPNAIPTIVVSPTPTAPTPSSAPPSTSQQSPNDQASKKTCSTAAALFNIALPTAAEIPAPGPGRSAGSGRFFMDPDGDKNIPTDCSCNDLPKPELLGPSSGDGCGHTFVSRVNWEPDGEGGMGSIQLVPTKAGRGTTGTPVLSNVDDPLSLRNLQRWMGTLPAYTMWSEFKCQAMAIGIPEDVVNTRTVFQQYMCHYAGVEIKAPGKPSYNFEPRRHALGTIGFIERGFTGNGFCN